MSLGLPRTSLAAIPLAVLACLLAAGSVRAACAVTSSAVNRADAVFVGVLTDVDANGTATFHVEELWRGDMLASGASASVDASQSGLELGPAGTTFRYLVLAGDRNGTLHIGDSPDACSLFAFPWDASYVAFRPAPAPITSEPLPDEGASFPVLPFVIGAAVVIAVAAFAVGASGRRPRPE